MEHTWSRLNRQLERYLGLVYVSAFFERLIFRATLKMSGWLQRNAQHRWRLIVAIRGGEAERPNPVVPSEAYGIPGAPISSYNVEYEKALQRPLQIERSADTAPQISAVVSLPAWAREIQPFLQNQLSDHTRRAYETDLRQFFLFLEGRLDPHQIEQLRPEHLILFRKSLEEGRVTGKPMSKATINRKLAVVKSFLNWLRLNRVIAENPGQLVKGFPQSQESALNGLSDEEVRKMLDQPDRNTKSGALHLGILSVLLYLGLRKGELIGLKVGDWDTERGVAVLKVRGKGHRVRVLPLTTHVKAALEHYFWVCRRTREDKEAPLFMPTKNPRKGILEKPLNPNAITYLVVRYARKAGVLKRISPHSCRATCISNALDRKATQRSVQHLAGWSTPLMIQRYDKRREDLKNSAAFLVDYEEPTQATG
jgi:integrase/recombinase XerD